MTFTGHTVKRWLAVHAGLDDELMKRAWFDRHIAQRLRELGLSDEQSYCALLGRDAAERERLIAQIAVGETWFFRYPESFALLVDYLTECRLRPPASSRLSMLSLACASGEEPYSMAAAALTAGWPANAVTIDALDRNPIALVAARRGRYSPRTLREDAPSWAQRWIRKVDGELLVADEARRLVRFAQVDVLEASALEPSEKYHAIFCRNLLIYLHPQARTQLVDRLANWIRPGGYLFVGHAEQLDALKPHFQAVDRPGSFALRRADRSAADASDVGAGSARFTAAQASTVLAAPETTGESPAPKNRKRAARGTRVERSKPKGRPAARPSGQPAARQAASEMETDGPLPDSRADAARRLADAGSLPDAAKATEAALREDGPSAELFHLLGSVRMAMGQMESARDAFRKAVYLEPLHEGSLLQLAVIYQALGDETQAASYRKRAARAHQQSLGEAPS
jgi:chemotaxis protein methyltransferase WspC